MFKPLVSVIVPCYNVEDVLEVCVDSILRQTYQNIEVILVDDGSTDRTGEICDAVCASATGITVIHQSNSGTSQAKNTGIDAATGEFLTFVDSDDVLPKDAISTLVDIAVGGDLQLVVGRFSRFFEGEPYIPTSEQMGFQIIPGSQQLLKLLKNQDELGAPWGKLYSSDLRPLLKFPERRLFEDVTVVARILTTVDRVAVTDQVVYGYRWRFDSITNQEYGEHHLQSMQRAVAELHEIVSDYPELVKGFRIYEALAYLRVAMHLSVQAGVSKRLKGGFLRNAKLISLRAALSTESMSRVLRIRFVLFAISPKLHDMIYSVLVRKHNP